MSDSEFVKNTLDEQTAFAPAAEPVLTRIHATIARKQARKRQAWMGATALVVAASITIPIVALRGRPTTATVIGAAQPSILASRDAVPPSAATSAPSATDGAAQPPMSYRPSEAPVRTSPAEIMPTTQEAPNAPTTITPAPTTPPAPPTPHPPTTANGLLDPTKLPDGLMPKGWTFYGTEDGARLYGVTPTRSTADPAVTLSVGTWSGVSWSTCAGLPAKTVDNGRGASYITMKIDSTHAYVLDLSAEPDFSRLTQAEADTVKSIGIDLCGDQVVWEPSDNQG